MAKVKAAPDPVQTCLDRPAWSVSVQPATWPHTNSFSHGVAHGHQAESRTSWPGKILAGEDDVCLQWLKSKQGQSLAQGSKGTDSSSCSVVVLGQQILTLPE